MVKQVRTNTQCVSFMRGYMLACIKVCMYVHWRFACASVCVHLCEFASMCVCVLSEAAPGRGSDIEDGLNPVLHSSGRP